MTVICIIENKFKFYKYTYHVGKKGFTTIYSKWSDFENM